MKILSLFGGMEVGYMACLDVGLKIDAYYSCEIDKFCNQQTKHNFKNIIQLGDVTKLNIKDLPKIDLLIGGSPCQGFSFAGKQLAFDDPRSALFFEFVKIKNELEKINPDLLFLLENVNMKKEYLRIISEYVGIFPVNINSNLVSAQNRNRWYWTNIRTKKVGLFDELYTDISQPEDQGILLKDILESEVDEKYYIKNPKFGFEGLDINGKNKTLRSGGKNSQTKKHNYDLICVAMREVRSEEAKKQRKETGTNNFRKKEFDLRTDGKTGALQTGLTNDNFIITKNYLQDNSNDHNSQSNRYYFKDSKSPGLGVGNAMKTPQILEPQKDGKTNTLTSVQKDNLIIQINPSKESGNKQPYQQNRVYDSNGQMPALNAELSGRNNISDNYRIRRLTVLECSRLQTIPEDYEFIVSNSQAYKILGNGWTMKVISYIFSFIK